MRKIASPKKDQNPWRAIGLVSAIGIDLAICVLLGFWGGRWLDRALHTDPLFLILGIVLGLALGLFMIVRLVKTFIGE